MVLLRGNFSELHFYTLSKTLIACRDRQLRFFKRKTLLNNAFNDALEWYKNNNNDAIPYSSGGISIFFIFCLTMLANLFPLLWLTRWCGVIVVYGHWQLEGKYIQMQKSSVYKHAVIFPACEFFSETQRRYDLGDLFPLSYTNQKKLSAIYQVNICPK